MTLHGHMSTHHAVSRLDAARSGERTTPTPSKSAEELEQAFDEPAVSCARCRHNPSIDRQPTSG
jgi:hypothetical protein